MLPGMELLYNNDIAGMVDTRNGKVEILLDIYDDGSQLTSLIWGVICFSSGIWSRKISTAFLLFSCR